ncbi:MAG: hypothetical protein JWN45_1226 [Acidobacteriaceae bacterium]|nr:hypothetical protein [Acidobacteriaceae bacterium]
MNANPILLQRPQANRFQLSATPMRRGLNAATHLKIYVGLVGICGLLLYVFSPALTLILSGILVGTPLLALGIVEARRDSLWINPLSLFLLYLGMQLGPAAAWEGIKLISDGSLDFPSLRISVRDIATGYFLTLIGTCVMALGLRAFRPRPGWQVAGPINWKPQWIFLLYTLGIAITYRPGAFLFMGAFSGVLEGGPLAVLLAFAFSSADRRGALSTKLLFCAGVAIYVAAAFFSDHNSKAATMLALLPVIVLVSRHQKYRKLIPAAAIFLAVLYLGVIAPAVNDSRTAKGRDSYDKVMTALYSSSPFYTGEPLLLSLQDQFDGLMGRLFEMPPVTGFMVSEVRRSGFQLGNTMKTLYYAFIPRIIWPGKPAVTRGAWFTTYLGVAPREAEATTSTGMTTVGEWYWNFGVLGVAVGMFLTGALLSGLWRLAGSYPIHKPANMVLYTATLIYVINLPDATSPIVSCVALYVLFGVVLYLRKVGRRPDFSNLARNNYARRAIS